MKTIQTNNGCFFIDDEDYDRVMKYKWYVNKNGYVLVWHGKKSKHKLRTSLHRFILDYNKKDRKENIDHIDRNPRNNTKANLRVVPTWKNNLNTRVYRTNTSGVKGVYHNPKSSKWDAYISINDRKRHIGSFSTLELAKEAREQFEKTMLSDGSLREPSIKRKNNKSGVTGVCYIKSVNRWKVKVKGEHKGFFKTFKEAVEARTAWDMSENKTKLGVI